MIYIYDMFTFLSAHVHRVSTCFRATRGGKRCPQDAISTKYELQGTCTSTGVQNTNYERDPIHSHLSFVIVVPGTWYWYYQSTNTVRHANSGSSIHPVHVP
jgi:hypothetical protein